MAVISDLPITEGIREKVVNRIKVSIENYLRERSISFTIKELNKLSERDLRDIGIHRSEINSKARLANFQKQN